MCGILGLFVDNPKQLTSLMTMIKKSASILKKRGPDSQKTIIKNNFILIFNRLRINDNTSSGDQPMISGDVYMMCNGEIYNHKELEEKYNIKCNSKSDCEIILHLYKKIGFVNTIKELRGVFAILLVDGKKIHVARDRVGVRPLYYGSLEGELLFISVPTPSACERYELKEVPPATIIEYENFQGKQVPYDSVVKSLTPVPLPDQLIRETLIECVKIRLCSDRKIACLLSGGLDSSIITAILVKLLGAEKVRTYSIGMENSTDLEYARKVSKYLNTQHTEVIFTPEEGISIIPEVISNIGSYDITTVRASVGMYLVSKYIKENSDDKVIFSGEGSDEIFGGYLYFHNAPSIEEFQSETERLLKNISKYDVLRADRCISSNGLEPRVPFLDWKFVNLAMSLSPRLKDPKENKGVEKAILRRAFEGFLPPKILWRRKEGFSDGVSSKEKPWYSYIQEHADKCISDEIFSSIYPSKEAMYYKLLFNKAYPSYNLSLDYWLPRWTDQKDPSGRLIQCIKNEEGCQPEPISDTNRETPCETHCETPCETPCETTDIKRKKRNKKV